MQLYDSYRFFFQADRGIVSERPERLLKIPDAKLSLNDSIVYRPLPELSSARMSKDFELEGSNLEITSIDVVPHGCYVLAGCSNGMVMLFDLSSPHKYVYCFCADIISHVTGYQGRIPCWTHPRQRLGDQSNDDRQGDRRLPLLLRRSAQRIYGNVSARSWETSRLAREGSVY